MSDEQVHCPKCNSTQLTAQKHGFSAGKAAAGAVLTGGIGLLAGTIGSNDIDITCLNCGHTWNPKKLHQRQQQEAKMQEWKDLKQWKSSIYSAYENNDLVLAESIYLSKYQYNTRMPDIHAVYKKYKSDDRGVMIFMLVFLAVLIGVIYLILR